MKSKFIPLVITTFFGIVCGLQGQTITSYKPKAVDYVNLSDNSLVTAEPILTKELKFKASNSSDAVFEVKLNEIIHSSLTGIGGAFNEQGGEAFMSLDRAQQKELARVLFNVKKGIGFSMCRTAIGASDFGLSAYSYSETPEDFEMEHFSVARDEKSVIPFIKAGYKQNKNLKIFASPWSPSGWMKESGTMDQGAIRIKNEETNRMMWVNNGKNYLRDQVSVYEAYALYFTKYVQAYKKHGITIDRIVIQNETDMNTKYPSCDMSPEQMSKLAFEYIKPAFDYADLKTGLWAGSFRGKRDDAKKFIALKGAKNIDGIAMQYAAPNKVKEIRNEGYFVMHTEGKCYNAKNTVAQARARFGEVCNWLNAGSENYCYWNMVLNEESKSGWGWKQNSMIKIDRASKEIIYNPDYAAMALFSKFIRPGDQSIKTVSPAKMNALAVRNKKQVVVFLQNDSEIPTNQNIKIGEETYNVELPVSSLCAYVFKPSN